MTIINTGLLESAEIDATVRIALDEDIGSGDLTAGLLDDKQVSARLICREGAVISGRPWFERCFYLLDDTVSINWLQDEGDEVQSNDIVCQLQGSASVLLTAERTALNFLQTLSAVATTTRQYVDAVQGTGCKILDTRKTLPGLRKAEKYSVSCGGGFNHRIGLYDAILIKENHIHAAGSICRALELADKTVDSDVLIEIEVEDLEQLSQAIECGAKRVLLDNFPIETLTEAVKLAGKTVETEVSGNITLDNVRRVANCGVNYVSIGALTKNVMAIDFSLLFTS
jgi:nicotinate-nucleotide pyrophosphorylase (carboxylating)